MRPKAREVRICGCPYPTPRSTSLASMCAGQRSIRPSNLHYFTTKSFRPLLERKCDLETSAPSRATSKRELRHQIGRWHRQAFSMKLKHSFIVPRMVDAGPHTLGPHSPCPQPQLIQRIPRMHWVICRHVTSILHSLTPKNSRLRQHTFDLQAASPPTTFVIPQQSQDFKPWCFRFNVARRLQS